MLQRLTARGCPENSIQDSFFMSKNKYFLEKSELYSHMSFSERGPENVGLMLQKSFDEDEELDFIKEDIRYKELMEELKSIKGKA